MELTPRLKSIANKVPQGARIADIGTDHAYLPVSLLLNDHITYAIASDINEGPLQRGMEVAKLNQISSERISFRLSDSLLGIQKDEVDTIVIAGMGGDTIAQCLDGVSWSRDSKYLFLLQPMTSIFDLRLWLQENGFSIESEEIVNERDKYYVILEVRYGQMAPMTLGELWVGKQEIGLRSEHRLDYICDTIKRRERAHLGMKQSKSPKSEEQINYLQAVLDDLYEIQKEWEAWQM